MTNCPQVSILVSARNEAAVIDTLLISLDGLTYPKENIQLLLADDQSEDNTFEILSNFTHSRPWARVVSISKCLPGLKGKTNALAQLADLANGQYLFFTDADIQLPPSWIESLLSAFKENTGVVVGITTMRPSSLWPAMQGIEWLMVLSLNRLLSNFSIPTTGMGNNMVVRKKAYEAVGGYEAIGFSIVEDYALYMGIIKEGFGFVQAFESGVVAQTLPPVSFFEQRKRWLKGAFQARLSLVIISALQSVTLPILLGLAFYNYRIALAIFAVQVFQYSVTIFIAQQKLKLTGYVKYLPFFIVYLPVAWFLQLGYYFLFSKTYWKGRAY